MHIHQGISVATGLAAFVCGITGVAGLCFYDKEAWKFLVLSLAACVLVGISVAFSVP